MHNGFVPNSLRSNPEMIHFRRLAVYMFFFVLVLFDVFLLACELRVDVAGHAHVELQFDADEEVMVISISLVKVRGRVSLRALA